MIFYSKSYQDYKLWTTALENNLQIISQIKGKMNQNRAAKTRTQAVIKLAKMMQLELAAAICSDYKLDFKERFSLKQSIHVFQIN